ncbi:MAG TPA: cytochrome c3 family protein, partial [Terriglobales bacterium]|nr:cytochrome c3 family protein [Terriglobales bacterium]
MARSWPTGWFFAAFALLCFLVCGKARLQAQISPGPLSKAHQSLSGVTQCTSCHKLGTGGALKCLECHSEIHKRLTDKLGFHAAVVKMNDPNRDCVRCHSEHNGENFLLVRWEPSREKFDHGKTGYALEGKHAALACQQCHRESNIQQEFRKLIKKKDLNKSFLGLASNCLSCHKDFHQGQLGKSCQNCHNSTNWKDVSGFNHAKTRYPLTGKHADVACAKCHAPMGPGLSAKYTGLNFASCSNCH